MAAFLQYFVRVCRYYLYGCVFYRRDLFSTALYSRVFEAKSNCRNKNDFGKCIKYVVGDLNNEFN